MVTASLAPCSHLTGLWCITRVYRRQLQLTHHVNNKLALSPPAIYVEQTQLNCNSKQNCCRLHCRVEQLKSKRAAPTAVGGTGGKPAAKQGRRAVLGGGGVEAEPGQGAGGKASGPASRQLPAGGSKKRKGRATPDAEPPASKQPASKLKASAKKEAEGTEGGEEEGTELLKGEEGELGERKGDKCVVAYIQGALHHMAAHLL